MKHKKPELVAPAGDWPSLYSAIDAGADSVYFGVKGMNMRHAASNFDMLEIKKVMGLLKKNRRKGYLSLNVIVFNDETAKVKKILDRARENGVDAVILWDMAVLKLAKEAGLNIHLSTQASVANFEALKFYSSLGVKRVVLARECSLSDIRTILGKIEQEKIDCRIETFIHGAMCVSISGRCFLSQESFSRSANRGKCLQPCRREFLIKNKEEDSQYILGRNYVLSSKDLCTIDIIDRLITSGIHAFKIEGRIRSPEYVKVVTSVYRKAIDAFLEDRLDGGGLKEDLRDRLKEVYNRGFSTGFYLGEPGSGDFSKELENEHEKVFLGEIVKFYKKISVAEIFIRNEGIKVGQEILISGRTTPASFAKVTELQQYHKPVDSACIGEAVAIKLPFTARPKDKAFIWRRRRK